MKCNYCGTENETGVKFCKGCGAKIEETVVETPKVESTSTPVEVNPPANSTPTPTVMPQPQPVPPKKKNDLVFIIIVIIIGIALICVPLILNMNKDKGKSNSNSNSNNSGMNTGSNSSSNTNPTTNTNENPSTNPNTNTNVNPSGTKSVTFKGYTFQLPQTAIYATEGDNLQITYLRTENDGAVLTIQATDFETLKSNKEYLKQTLATSGYEVGDMEIKTVGGVEFITAPIKLEGISMLCAISKIGTSDIALIMLVNSTYTIDYTLLDVIAPIISGAKSANEL